MLIKELKRCKGHFTLKQIQQWDLDLSSVKFWPLFPRRKNIRPKKGQDNVIAVNKRSLLSVFPAKSCTTQVQTVTFTGWKNDGRGEGAEESQHRLVHFMPKPCRASCLFMLSTVCKAKPWRESLDVRECTSWSALSGIQYKPQGETDEPTKGCRSSGSLQKQNRAEGGYCQSHRGWQACVCRTGQDKAQRRGDITVLRQNSLHKGL